MKICKESGKSANEYCYLAEGNTIEEVGKLIYNEDWKVNKDADFVYNEKDEDAVCKLHTEENTKPTVPTLPTEPTEPTEPSWGGWPGLPWH